MDILKKSAPMVLLAMMSMVLVARAQTRGSDSLGAEFGYQPTSEPIIVMDVDVGIRTPEPTTPLLRIFGDGLVLVHIPPYRQNAGDFKLRLSGETLQALVASLSEKGLMSFDASAVKADKAAFDRAVRERAAAEGKPLVLTYRSDDMLTIVDISLDSYKPAGGTEVRPFQKRVAWYGVAWDARNYPDLSSLQDLAAGVAQLSALVAEASQPGD